MPPETDAAAPSRTVVIVATALAAALAVTVAIIGVSAGNQGDDAGVDPADEPAALPAVDAPDADSAACDDLIDALPEALPSAGDELDRRELAEPAPDAAAAWGTGEPVVLRCGLGKPGELTSTSRLRQVNDVQWLPTEIEGADDATWYAVDRDVYIALTIPGDHGTGPLQRISDIIADTLDATDPEP